MGVTSLLFWLRTPINLFRKGAITPAFLIVAMSMQAATVTNTLQDITGNNYDPEIIRFVPIDTPLADGTHPVLDIPRRCTPTNGFFSMTLAGGRYDVDFGAGNRAIRILVPWNDTNTYPFTTVAALAYNGGIIFYTNGWARISSRIVPGAGFNLSTNNPGTLFESLTLNSTGGGSATNVIARPLSNIQIITNVNGSDYSYGLTNTPSFKGNYVTNVFALTGFKTNTVMVGTGDNSPWQSQASVSIGYQAAVGDDAVSIGFASFALTNSVAIGSQCDAAGSYAVAIGQGTHYDGDFNVIIGYNLTGSGTTNCVLIAGDGGGQLDKDNQSSIGSASSVEFWPRGTTKIDRSINGNQRRGTNFNAFSISNGTTTASSLIAASNIFQIQGIGGQKDFSVSSNHMVTASGIGILSGTIYDQNSTPLASVDVSDRILADSGGHLSIEWDTHTLDDKLDAPSLDYDQRILDGAWTFNSTLGGNGSLLTALNASSLASGTVPAARLGSGSATANTLLHGNSTYSATVEADQSLSDVTTANASTSKHGYAPKGDGNSAHYLDGTLAWSTPAGGGGADSTAWHKTGDANGTTPFIAGNTNANDYAIRGQINGVAGATWLQFFSFGNNPDLNIYAGASNGAVSATESSCSIWGGRNNTISSAGKTFATIVGGGYNNAGNDWATVLGGVTNAANGKASVAAGQGATAANDNSFAWGGIANFNVTTSGSGGDNGVFFIATDAPGLRHTNNNVGQFTSFGSSLYSTNTKAIRNATLQSSNSGNFATFYLGTNPPSAGHENSYNAGVIASNLLFLIEPPNIAKGFYIDTNANVGIAGAIGFANGNGVINFTNSGRYSRVGPYTGPDSGVTIYGTNAGSANALTSLIDVAGGGIVANVGITATTLNKWTFTAPTTAATLTAGADNLTYTGPSTSQTLVGRTSTDTLTNKRITARITSISSSATPTVNSDNCDCVTITALAAAITSMTSNLSGTPTDFDQLEYRIKDDGTARAITWGASFVAGPAALPTTTIISKALHVYFEWDSVQSKWVCISTGSDA